MRFLRIKCIEEVNNGLKKIGTPSILPPIIQKFGYHSTKIEVRVQLSTKEFSKTNTTKTQQSNHFWIDL